MARIRKVEIENFRGIAKLEWFPNNGINCLIGSGDSGKSTILDAIDLCLGARRNLQITDADFHDLNVNVPIKISLVLGDLEDGLKKIDTYGLYLRGYDLDFSDMEDEPGNYLETVLELHFEVADDLEPSWFLFSDRAVKQGQERNLSWGDRVRLAPTRIGAFSDTNLSWRKGSILNSLSEGRVDASKALLQSARDARDAFTNQPQDQLNDTLKAVSKAAKDLGISVGEEVKAMLDAHSVSVSGGTVSLHNQQGVPLRGLGIGSTRLLVAGLQREAAKESAIVLIDELEHGLEPHRIIRLLGSLGAKEADEEPVQAFLTTHSPAALRELSGDQLFVVCTKDGEHNLLKVGNDAIQGTIRSYPEAFLAVSVLVCEGASEVGFIRGIDFSRVENAKTSLFASGATLVDAGGETKILAIASAFQALGYRVAILRDNDVKFLSICEKGEKEFLKKGGKLFTWCDGSCLEQEIFKEFSPNIICKMVELAISIKGKDAINDHIKSASNNNYDLDSINSEIKQNNSLSINARKVLGDASKGKKNPWFKTITAMEQVGRIVDGERGSNACEAVINTLFTWFEDVHGKS